MKMLSWVKPCNEDVKFTPLAQQSNSTGQLLNFPCQDLNPSPPDLNNNNTPF